MSITTNFQDAKAGVGKHRYAPRENCYRAVRNQGQAGPKVTGMTDVRNTLRVPLNVIPTGRSILLRQSKPRSLI